MSVSLPERMLDLVDRACEVEQRSRSQLVREALRWYLERLPTEQPTPKEIDAMKKGRAEFDRGDYVTLAGLDRGVAHRPRKVGRKRA